MRASLLRWRAAVGIILLTGIVLSWGVILLHNHQDGRFRETCPACQQERVVAGQPSASHVGPTSLAPAFVPDRVGFADVTVVWLDPIVAIPSPRSPPPAL